MLRPSQYGYPDWYIRHRQTYQNHPPLPAFGWHAPSEQIDFNVLFHSLFHGYIVVQYRSDISAQGLETLRKWVTLHADERVTLPQRGPMPLSPSTSRGGGSSFSA